MRFDTTLAPPGGTATPTPGVQAQGWLNPTPGSVQPGAGGLYGDPRDGGSRSHQGVDLGGNLGAGYPIRAAADGVARYSKSPNGGWILWVEHQNGWLTKYMHLGTLDDKDFTKRKPGGTIQPYAVADGQQVRAGQVIGYMGDSGNPDRGAYHLHFEMWQNGTPVDPMTTGFFDGIIDYRAVDNTSTTFDSMFTAPGMQAGKDQLRTLLGGMLATASRVTAGPTGRLSYEDVLAMRQQRAGLVGEGSYEEAKL